MPSSAFARFWQTDLTRDAFLSHATKDDLCSLRLVSHEFADVIAASLFKTTHVHFDINTFSRRHRMAALDRIGHHIKTFHFNMPHTEATFLPPLIDPETLEEIDFQYEPQAFFSRPSSSSSSELSSSKYGSWEINDILVRQYPPLFHAATNIGSFIRAFSVMPYLRHLRISCPHQPAGQRYRRDIIDYALISLRMAMEQANPLHIDTLSLDPIHPGAIYYLRPQNSLGTSPASTRVWHRITKLNIKMDSFVRCPDDTTDHLKILHTYLQTFRSLKHLSFVWLGERGPCPLSLDAELRSSSSTSSLDCCSLSSGSTSSKTSFCYSTSTPSHRPLRFRHLRSMCLENALLDATQASSFITQHRKVLHEVDFANCHLRSGTWDDALEPLTQRDWKNQRLNIHTTQSHESEVMDVPIMFTPTDDERLDPLLTMAAMSECIVKEQLWGEDAMRLSELELGKAVRALNVLRRVGYRGREVATLGSSSGFDGFKRLLRSVKLVRGSLH